MRLRFLPLLLSLVATLAVAGTVNTARTGNPGGLTGSTISGLPTINASSATFVTAIDATPTASKVAVNAANGVPIYDASVNLNPPATNTSSLGLTTAAGGPNVWKQIVFPPTTVAAVAPQAVMFDNGVAVQGSISYVAGVGPVFKDFVTTNAVLAFNTQGFTAKRTVVWPDAAGTVTVLGNASTGSGSVVLASAPTIDQLNATTILGWTGGFKNNTSGRIIISATNPTIASGFGTSPSIVTSNGTAAFTINVGTGGTASSGVVTMPAASNGWACIVTPNGTPQAGAVTYSAPTSTTSITITNYTLSTAATLAWPASAVLQVVCTAY